MKAFVIAETQQGAVELCAGARSMADEVALCIVGGSAVAGVADVCYHIEVPEESIADDAYPAVNRLFDGYDPDLVLAEETVCVLSLAGRLAAHSNTAVTVGAKSIDGACATTLYFGGTGVRTSEALARPAVYAMGAGAFDAAGATGTDVVEEVAFEAPASAVQKLGEEPLPKSDVNLQGADIVVGCGSGFAEEADLQLARDFAAKIGGELGCTRPLAEGVCWFPKEAYIGVTGQMLSPRVYIGIGVSGQMQHMIGVSSADVVVAINKDKNAPIFKQCDLGYVGDLKEVLPALTAAL